VTTGKKKKTPAVPSRMPPSGAGPGYPFDILQSAKGRRVIRRFLGRRAYRDLVQGKRDVLEVEDALAEELKARAARLRRGARSTGLDEAEVMALQEGAEVLRAILEGRNALVAMLDEAMGKGP